MKLKIIKSKKGTLELSIGTIVIVVLAMSMLILGLIFVRTIFVGSEYNIKLMNNKVKGEISNLFAEDQRSVINLPDDRVVNIEEGKDFGLGFGIQNTLDTQKFKWKVEIVDKSKCDVSESEAESWILTGGSGNIDLEKGEKYADLIRINIPEKSVGSKCEIRYKIVVENEDGDIYTVESFILETRDGEVFESREKEYICGNGVCEEGEADDPGGCKQFGINDSRCLGPPSKAGTCPQDCEVVTCAIYCPEGQTPNLKTCGCEK